MDTTDPTAASRPAVAPRPLAVVLAAASAGILADRYAPIPLWISWVLAAVAMLSWGLLWRKRWRVMALAFLLAGTAFTAAAWHHCRWYLFSQDELARYAPRDAQPPLPVCLEAVACEAPQLIFAGPSDALATRPQGDRTRFRVRALRVRSFQRWHRVSGYARVQVEGHLVGVAAGDRLRLFGDLRQAGPPLNPGQYDYRHVARARRELCFISVSYPDCVHAVPGRQVGLIRPMLQRLRTHCDRILMRRLDPEQSALAAAILLGIRERLPESTTDAFFHTGTVHLLAISGLHVGILASVFLLAARGGVLPLRPTLRSVMILTVLYALLTGARAPVVRATILIVVVCGGWIARRSVSGLNSLSAAALVVLALSPADLFQVGAQLSFVAVAALMWLAPRIAPAVPDDPLDRLIWRTRPWAVRWARRTGLRICQLAAASLAVWLITLPLVVHTFHLITPIAVLLNVVLWLPMAVALMSALGIYMFDWLFPPLASLLAHIATWMLKLLQGTVQAVEHVPMSHVWAAGPGAVWTILFYVVAGTMLFQPRWRVPKRWCIALLLAWFAAPLGMALFRPTLGSLPPMRCTTIALGHGLSVLVQLPGGQNLLYDAGHMGSPDIAVDAISAVLWDRGVRHLDAIVVSHADADHYNGLPGILDRFSVGVVYAGPGMFDRPTTALGTVWQSIQRQGVPLRVLHAGLVWTSPEQVRIATLHPPAHAAGGTDNARSIVLWISYRGRSVVLPGDLEGVGLDRVLSEPAIDCDLALAPHHGSLNSRQVEFCRWCRPDWLVVSGRDARDAMALQQLLDGQMTRVLHTARDGAVTASWQDQWEVTTFVNR